MSFVIIMVLLLVVMYVLMIRPQRQRQAETQRLVDAAGVGDDILTTGGIYGTITAAHGDDIEVEVADGLRVHMTRRAVAAVLPPEEDEADVVDGEAVEEPDGHEDAVAQEEGVVSTDGGAGTPVDSRL